MKYILPCLFLLLLVLIFYPNDYDETDTAVYVGNNKYYAVNNSRQGISSEPGTFVVNTGGRPGSYGAGGADGWIMPVNSDESFYISSLIGYRILSGDTPKYHRGFDISNGKSGSDVLSIGDGSVVDIKPDPNGSSFGICVTVRYSSSQIGNFCVIYAHLSSYDTSLAVGGAVKRGQAIGQIGNTGNSFGPHLHWQCFYGVKYSDLYNSFNPFQTLYPAENKAAAISGAYGFTFYEPGGYKAENAFYSAYSANKNTYSDYYEENRKLGMLPDDFFN